MKDFHRIDFQSKVNEKLVELNHIDHNKTTLILDLDETLVHADFHCQFGLYDEILQFVFENETISIPLILRPGVREFLNFIKDKFNVIVFTAGRKEYADCVFNYLDPNHDIFKYRFYRDDCISVKGKIFVKDLRIFRNLNLARTIIIDNSLYSFANQLTNGILITSFYNNKQDFELLNLMKYIKSLYINDVRDVRTSNNDIFNFERIKEQIDNENKIFE